MTKSKLLPLLAFTALAAACAGEDASFSDDDDDTFETVVYWNRPEEIIAARLHGEWQESDWRQVHPVRWAEDGTTIELAIPRACLPVGRPRWAIPFTREVDESGGGDYSDWGAWIWLR